MAYELKATLQLVDKLTEPMKKATNAVREFKKSVDQAKDALKEFDRTHRSIRGTSASINSAGKAFGSTAKQIQKDLKGTQQSANKTADEMLKIARAQALNTEVARKNAIAQKEMEVAAQKGLQERKRLILQNKGIELKANAAIEKAKVDSEGKIALAEKRGAEVRRADTRKNRLKMVSDAKATANYIKKVEASVAAASDKELAKQATINAKTASSKEIFDHKLANSKKLVEHKRLLADKDKEERRAYTKSLQQARKQEAAYARLQRRSIRNIGRGYDVIQGAGGAVASGLGTAALYGGVAMGAGAYVVGNAAVQGFNQSMNYDQQLVDIIALTDKNQRTPGLKRDIDKYIKNESMNTVYSKEETATAYRILQKAGSQRKAIEGGELKDALNLAQAIDWDTENSAEFMVNMRSAFGKGLQTTQVADRITGVSNASTTDGRMLSLGMSQAANAAYDVGMSFNDLSSWMGLMAKDGIFGSDAGTSIKVLLGNLVHPSGPAIDDMKKVGWIDKQGNNAFFNKDGTIKSLDEISKLVYESTKHLNGLQRSKLFTQIGGDDARRSLTNAYKNGEMNRVTEFEKQVTQASASEIAADRMNSTLAKWKQFKNMVSILMDELFGPVLEPFKTMFIDLKNYVKQHIPAIQEFSKKFGKIITDLYNAFKNSDDAKFAETLGEKVKAMFTFAIDAFTVWYDNGGKGKIEQFARDFMGGLVTFIEDVGVPLLIVGLDAIWAAFKAAALMLWEKHPVIATLIGGALTLAILVPMVSFVSSIRSIGLGIIGIVNMLKKNPLPPTTTPPGTVPPGGKPGGNGRSPLTPTDKVKPSWTSRLKGAWDTTKDVTKKGWDVTKKGGKVVWDTTKSTGKWIKNNPGKMTAGIGSGLLLGGGLMFFGPGKTEAGETPEDIKRWEQQAKEAAEKQKVVTQKAKDATKKSVEKTTKEDQSWDSIIKQIEAETQVIQNMTDASLLDMNARTTSNLQSYYDIVRAGQEQVSGAVVRRDQNVVNQAIQKHIATINSTPFTANPGQSVVVKQKTVDEIMNPYGLPKKAGGDTRVGKDGPAYLHKDEMVLPRGAANAYRNGNAGGGSPIIISGNTFNVRDESDIDKIAKALARELNLAGGSI